jgi:hypothetical protein
MGCDRSKAREASRGRAKALNALGAQADLLQTPCREGSSAKLSAAGELGESSPPLHKTFMA